MHRADWTAIYKVAPAKDDVGVADDGWGAAAEAVRTATSGCSHDHSTERRVIEMSARALLASCASRLRSAQALASEGAYARAAAAFRRSLAYTELADVKETDDTDYERACKSLALLRVRARAALGLSSCLARGGGGASVSGPGEARAALVIVFAACDEATEILAGSGRSSVDSSTSPKLTREAPFFARVRALAHFRRASECAADLASAARDCDSAEAALAPLAGADDSPRMYAAALTAREVDEGDGSAADNAAFARRAAEELRVLRVEVAEAASRSESSEVSFARAMLARQPSAP